MLAIDLYCGLGGWAEGLLAEGWDVIGFDIEVHDYGLGRYPGDLVLQDVTTLDGAQLAGADLIVASPPCQAYSYRAMPWKRAKALPPPDNTLFEECFRLRAEASEFAGRRIPIVVENVLGAQRWVGKAQAHYGSYYLWGDVETVGKRIIARGDGFGGGLRAPRFGSKDAAYRLIHNRQFVKDNPTSGYQRRSGIKQPGMNWSNYGKPGYKAEAFNGTKVPGGAGWFGGNTKHELRTGNYKSIGRKAASAKIAKIPFPLARYIAQSFKQQTRSTQ